MVFSMFLQQLSVPSALKACSVPSRSPSVCSRHIPLLWEAAPLIISNLSHAPSPPALVSLQELPYHAFDTRLASLLLKTTTGLHLTVRAKCYNKPSHPYVVHKSTSLISK